MPYANNCSTFGPRLVPNGCEDNISRELDDEIHYEGTFSPFVRFTSILLMLIIVAHLDLDYPQMDVKIKFLKRELETRYTMACLKLKKMRIICTV